MNADPLCWRSGGALMREQTVLTHDEVLMLISARWDADVVKAPCPLWNHQILIWVYFNIVLQCLCICKTIQFPSSLAEHAWGKSNSESGRVCFHVSHSNMRLKMMKCDDWGVRKGTLQSEHPTLQKLQGSIFKLRLVQKWSGITFTCRMSGLFNKDIKRKTKITQPPKTEGRTEVTEDHGLQ